MGDASRRWGMPGWFCRGTRTTDQDRSPCEAEGWPQRKGSSSESSDASLCSSLRSLRGSCLPPRRLRTRCPWPVSTRSGANDSGATASYVRGGQITLDWATIEPQRKTFNWSSLDSELKYYASIGKVATVQVNSTTKPAWLWNVVARCGSVQGQAAPQYWDPAYMTRADRAGVGAGRAPQVVAVRVHRRAGALRPQRDRHRADRPAVRLHVHGHARPATRSRRSGRRTCATPTTTTS